MTYWTHFAWRSSFTTFKKKQTIDLIWFYRYE